MRTLFVALLLLAATSSARALSDREIADIIEAAKQSADGQGALKFTRVTRGGQFDGCELQFSGGMRDWRSQNGELVRFTGSVSSFYERGKHFFVLVKLVGEDLRFNSKAHISQARFVPHHVSIRTQGATYGQGGDVQKLQCEAGYTCWMFATPGWNFAKDYANSLAEGSLELLITRARGSMDLSLDLAKLKESQDTAPHFWEFVSCYSELLRKFGAQD
ncbi:MAG: hypothetical protein K2X67_13035 [Burkholderiales bacterium]|nr:hypothetical protein [Burkholderiales bacterium]